jgi:outer membrane protein OmpA-like peptidoglycan-associated protein
MTRTFWLGVFVISSLLILATGIFLIGGKQFLFSRTYRLQADFRDVGELGNGSDVLVGGIREGTVQQINLPGQPDGKVTVVMKMHDATRGIVRKDSIATIKTEGLLGTKYVEISFGSKSGANVQNGDYIRGEDPVDISNTANEIGEQAKAGLTTLQEDMEALKHNFLLRGYFNNRGYEDSSDLTKHSISRLPAKPHSKEFDFNADDLFNKPDEAKLKNQKALGEAGKFLEDNRFGLVVVAAGETMGDSEKDRVLTQARAMVVRDYLVENFRLDDTRIKTLGLGKLMGQGVTSSRVQILVYPPDSTSHVGQIQLQNRR